MKNVKIIEKKEIPFSLSDCEIDFCELANILGGVSILVRCNVGETLNKADYTCNVNETLDFHCAGGATLNAVYAAVSINGNGTVFSEETIGVNYL